VLGVVLKISLLASQTILESIASINEAINNVLYSFLKDASDLALFRVNAVLECVSDSEVVIVEVADILRHRIKFGLLVIPHLLEFVHDIAQVLLYADNGLLVGFDVVRIVHDALER
jgi:hypothetical protein